MKKMFIILSVLCLFVVGVGGVYADEDGKDINDIINPPTNEKVSCKDYKEITGTAWLIIRIAAPVLLLIYGAIDMGKAVMAGDEKEMKKATDTFVKRIILCVAIFLLPIVVDLIMGIFSGEGITACL
jgi:hypothetical protein